MCAVSLLARVACSCNPSNTLQRIEGLTVALDFFEDVSCRLGPNKSRRRLIAFFDTAHHRLFPFRHAAENTTTSLVLREVSEEALDHVQQRGAGRRKVHMDALVVLQPALHLGMRMRGIVAPEDVDFLVLTRVLSDRPKEVRPLGLAMLLGALAKHFSGEDLQCCK